MSAAVLVLALATLAHAGQRLAPPEPPDVLAQAGEPFDAQRAAVLRQYASSDEVADVSRVVGAQLGDRRWPVVMAVTDSGECFARQIENWACTMKRFAIRPYVIFALDNSTHVWLLAQGEPSVRVRSVSSFGGEIGKFGAASYRQANFAKIHAVLLLTGLGHDALVLDVDVLLRADPRPALVALAVSDSRDALFQLNYPTGELNGGVYLLRSTPGALRLMRTIAYHGRLSAERDGAPGIDQDILNEFLNRDCAAGTYRAPRHVDQSNPKSPVTPPAHIVVSACRGFALSLASLDARLYRTGQMTSMRLPEPGTAVLWHAKYMVGGYVKHSFMLGDFGGRRLWCSANLTLCGKLRETVEQRPIERARHQLLRPPSRSSGLQAVRRAAP